MDMHHNKYGHVITDKELIMFRRRDWPEWGHIVYSPFTPISGEQGQLNALMVLWYFHVRYAVMNENGGWQMESCYHKDLEVEYQGNSQLRSTPNNRSCPDKKASSWIHQVVGKLLKGMILPVSLARITNRKSLAVNDLSRQQGMGHSTLACFFNSFE
jgi:hypothetical protein